MGVAFDEGSTLHDEINIALQKPEVHDRLVAQGITNNLGTAEAAKAFIDRQQDVWAKVVKDNGIKAD